jgi:uncharacterized protein DUF4265
MSNKPTAKVLFRVPDDEGGAMVETLWATPLGGDHYKLDNSPFYAYGVSWEDTVFAPYDDKEGFPTFRSVVAKSGNRTIRTIVDPPVSPGNAADQVLQALVALGCSYEGAYSRCISVNIPSTVELKEVSSYLIEQEVQWEYADPTYESLFPGGA